MVELQLVVIVLCLLDVVCARCEHYGKHINANIMGCNAGYYCSGTGQQWAWSGTCKQCESGFYCPGGRGIDYKRENAAPKFPCPAGKWVRELGKSSCNPCPVGKYSTLVGAYYFADCKSCPKGKYMSSTAASACTDCSPGRYSTGKGSDSSSSCEGCPTGKYMSGMGATSCTSCPKGTYMSSKGASVCTSCAPGKYSVSVGSSTASHCVNCEKGKASFLSGATSCTSCAKGKYMNLVGSSVCTDCSVGKYSISIGALSSTQCVDCTKGKYMSSTGATACLDCPKGRYSHLTGYSACEPCGQGKYASSLGAAACTDCLSGKYSTAVGATSSSFCISCGTGKFSSVKGATDSSTCEDCRPGRYSSTIASARESNCLLCPAGTFNPSPGASSVSACSRCSSGKFNNKEGAISCQGCTPGRYLSPENGVNKCLDCVSGKYSEGGGIECSDCEVGRYSKSPGSPICTLCGPGKYTDKMGSTSCDKLCPAGTFSTEYGSSSKNDCKKCDAGTFQFLAGSSTCVVCSPGSFSGEAGSEVCLPCDEANTYSDGYGLTSCKACPEGKIARTRGAVGCAVPLPCPGGAYSFSGQTPCNLCPPGKTSAGASGSTECQECPDGAITESSGQASCRMCSLQEISLKTRDGCVPCDGNSIPDPKNKFRCKKCPGDELASSLGECSVKAKCGPGEFSVSGYGPDCQPCPAGTYGSSSGSTACVLCPFGAYTDSVGNVYPTSCPDNTFTATNGSIHVKECIECSGDTIVSSDRDECKPCLAGEYASGGQCLKKLSNAAQDAVGGVFANKGLPFYILVILSAVVLSFSLLVYFSKEKRAEKVLSQTMMAHVAQHVMPCAGLISEMILCVAVLQVGLSSVRVYGIVLLLSRVLVAPTPGLVVINAIFGSAVTVGSDGTKSYRYYIISEILTFNGKTYVALLFLSILEPPLLSFLPWHETDFSKVALFPTIGLMKLCYLFKFMQLMVTLSAQVGLLVTQISDASSTFGTIVILNLIFTLVVVVTKSSEMAMKISLLSGRAAVLSDDCSAARKAVGLCELKDVEKDSGAAPLGPLSPEKEGGNEELNIEFATIYPPSENPLHVENPIVHASSCGDRSEDSGYGAESEREALLGDIKKVVQEHSGLLQWLRNEVDAMRSHLRVSEQGMAATTGLV